MSATAVGCAGVRYAAGCGDDLGADKQPADDLVENDAKLIIQAVIAAHGGFVSGAAGIAQAGCVAPNGEACRSGIRVWLHRDFFWLSHFFT